MSDLIDAAEVVGRREVEIAVAAIVDVAQVAEPEQRLRAAEILLNYGVRSPWAATGSNIVDEDVGY